MEVFRPTKLLMNFLNSVLLTLAVSCNGFIGEVKIPNFAQGLQNNISINLSDVNITEGDSNTFLLSFTAPAPQDFTIKWTLSGTGVSSDFPVTSGTIPVLKGATTVTKTIHSTDNLISDGTRVYTLTFESLDGSVMNPIDVSYTIIDDEPSSVPSVTISDVTQAEGTGAGNTTFTFTVTTSFTPGVDVHLNYATADGTATSADSDYISATGSITIPAGSTTETITVDVVRDAKFEVNETFTVTLSGGSGYTSSGSDLTATGTISNDDTAPTISLSSPSIAEGTGAGFTTLAFDVTLSQASGVNVVVNYNTTDGTATIADSDYITAASTLTILAGATSGTININVVKDARYENDETINLTLSGGSGYTSAGSILTNTGTITNDDAQPTISIADVAVTEGTGAGTTNLTFTITQNVVSGLATTVNYATSNGTAHSATDYTATSGTATIAAGATTTTINVPITRDALDENDELILMTLSGGTNYNPTGSTLTAFGTITDDDIPPTISIANATITEGGNLSFTVTLSTASGRSVGFDFNTSDGTAVAGSDYTTRSSNHLFAAGVTTSNITVNTTDDAENCESSETITATLSNVTNATAGTLTATGTILENDIPIFSVNDSTVTEGNTATLTVSNSVACPTPITFNYATRNNQAIAGQDYSYQENTVTILANQTSANFNITTINDNIPEPRETFFVRLNGNSVGTFDKPAAVITLLDNDNGATTTAKVRTALNHTCVLSNTGNVKCWGYSTFGRLGYGEIDIGDSPNEMGINLRAVDLGTGLEPIKVAVGEDHSCAILSDGSPNKILKCWGDNSYGVLGQGHTNLIGKTPSEMGNNILPIDLGTNRYASDVCAGLSMTCALLDNGDVKCWGYGISGLLGNGIDGTTRGDGANEMGDNLPKVDFGVGITASKISCGTEHLCAVVSDGSVRCWGRNGSRLGSETFGNIGLSGTVPAVDVGPNLTSLDVAVGTSHSCGLFLDTSDNKKKIKCWGSGAQGQVGADANVNWGDEPGEMGTSLPFVNFSLPLDEPTKLWAGSMSSCAEFASGRIRCWGAAYSNGSSSNARGAQAGQMAVLPDINFGTDLTTLNFTTIGRATCAIVQDLSANKFIKCFGLNSAMLGQGDITTPSGWIHANDSVTLDHGTGTPIALSRDSGSANHICAIIDNGANDEIRCWGFNQGGQLGRADLIIGDVAGELGANLPNINLGLDGGGSPYVAQDIVLGGLSTCILMTNGDVKCFGYNANNQLGTGGGTYGDGSGETVAALPPLNLGRPALSVIAQGSSTCALLNNFTLKCWGANGSGQLGIENTTAQPTPPASPINFGTNRFAINVSTNNAGSHSCAVLDNDTVKCWGDNTNGSLGYNFATNAHVGDGANEMGDNLGALNFGVDGSSNPYIPLAVFAGSQYTCTLMTDGNVKCWGSNSFSQLGINSTTSTGAAAQATIASTILTWFGQPVIYIGTGYRHSCAILADFSMKCWGYNTTGNLGNGNTTAQGNASTPMSGLGPVNVGAFTVVDVSTQGNGTSGLNSTCALLSNGDVKCWGGNDTAQLGTGDLVNRGTIGTETPNLLPAVDISW